MINNSASLTWCKPLILVTLIKMFRTKGDHSGFEGKTKNGLVMYFNEYLVIGDLHKTRFGIKSVDWF